jgi:hypothetical protein
MATHQISIFGPIQDAPARKVAGSLRLAATTLNGEPVSVELQVQVHFKLNS